MQHAACIAPDVDADSIFFPPERWESREDHNSRIDAAKTVCARCPVLVSCRTLVDRLERGQEQIGVWAGETARERRTRREAALRAADEALAQ